MEQDIEIGIFYERLKVADVVSADDGVKLIYSDDWLGRRSAFPISLSMPLRKASYGNETIMPWLANLLPESHLSRIGQQIGVSPQDVLGILLEIGRDTAGAFAIGHPRQEGGDEFRVVENEADLQRVIEDLPLKPFLIGEEGVSMSLAGAQEKIAVALVGGNVAIPLHGTASTHILKPDVKTLKGSVQNEAFCLVLAGLIGLEVAKPMTGKARKRQYLLVERYDRVTTSSGVRRIHQEDLAQVLGYFPKDKYEFNGIGAKTGPGLKEMFAAVGKYISPGARLTLLNHLIFNVATCNSDAHAKNYSLMIGAAGSARLAPIYDVLCGEVWPNITKMLPQQLGGHRRAAEINGGNWQTLALEVGLNPRHTLDSVAIICDGVRQKADEAREIVEAMPAGGNENLKRACFEVKKRADRLARQLEIGKMKHGRRRLDGVSSEASGLEPSSAEPATGL